VLICKIIYSHLIFDGGDKLTVKTAADEFSAPLTELHDAWWNSIARAMA
jgi:hypothetical protein